MNKIKTPFVAPLVDRLSIRVLVDSAYERFLPKTSHEFCNIEHVGKIPGRQMTTLACEWGLSLHLESLSNGENAQYLLDFGYTPEIISRNFELLDIDPKKISGLILSHAHRDHYGGMEGFIDRFPMPVSRYTKNKKKMKFRPFSSSQYTLLFPYHHLYRVPHNLFFYLALSFHE